MADARDHELAGAPDATRDASARPSAGESPRVHWDNSQVTRAYANQCSVSTSREEFVLSFGVSQAAEKAQAELLVQLSQQIIMNPHIAKHFTILLDKVLQEHGARFGLPTGAPGAAATTAGPNIPTSRTAKPRPSGR